MAVNDLIQIRNGPSAAWTSANPVLASGEPGYDLTNKTFKIGDGVSNWGSLGSINLSSSNVINFNSSVSGILPVKNIVAGTNISVSSASGNYTVNSIPLISYPATSGFPASGVSTSYYLASDSSRFYQWTGSQYVEIGSPTSTLSATDPTVGLTLLHPFLLGGM